MLYKIDPGHPNRFDMYTQILENWKKIQKILAVDHNGAVLLTFDKIIEKNRFFTVGIWPDQDIFKAIFKFHDDKAIKTYQDPISVTKGCYQEIPLQLEEIGLSLPMALSPHTMLRGLIV